MSCKRCKSERIMSIQSHCVDRFFATLGDKEYGPDYVPHDMGIGGGDDVDIDLCLDCGQEQGEYPVYPECFQEDEDE